MDLPDITNPHLQAMIDLCKKEVPDFDIQYKDSSRLMKFLNFFARIFNKEFMTRYTTTMNTTVYFPSKAALLERQETYAEVLAHELVHMKERLAIGGPIYFLRYAFPQILTVLALFSVLAFVNLWFLLFLVFLLALLPLPAPGRRDIELRGYTMSMAVDYWKTGVITDAAFEWYAKQFSGPNYYFMWPWHQSAIHNLKLKAIAVRTGDLLEDPMCEAVYNIFKKQ